jgi:hypothetical protein
MEEEKKPCAEVSVLEGKLILRIAQAEAAAAPMEMIHGGSRIEHDFVSARLEAKRKVRIVAVGVSSEEGIKAAYGAPYLTPDRTIARA